MIVWLRIPILNIWIQPISYISPCTGYNHKLSGNKGKSQYYVHTNNLLSSKWRKVVILKARNPYCKTRLIHDRKISRISRFSRKFAKFSCTRKFPVLQYGILNLMGCLYKHNIVFPCFNLICDCILYMVHLHID